MNSRDKDARGERELAHWLTEHGHPARRGCQYQGGQDSPDVVCDSLPFHFEAKRTEKLRLYDAMQQAITDAGDNVPVVAHRRSRGEWLAIMRLSDLVALVDQYGTTEATPMTGVTPTTATQARRERNKKIIAEFRGDNRLEVSQRHGISESTLYRVVNGY